MDDFVAPSPKRVHRLFSVPRWYFRPEFFGAELLDVSRPALYVGNHTLYGLLDVPLMAEHLYTQHGILLRSLGDKGHFSVPLWRDYLTRNGMVLGTPENCDALMEAGESILVFPGGAREVMRRRGEKYQLLWKKRLGFARMAIKHGYDIVPFASLGPDDCFDILIDGNDINSSARAQKLLDGTWLGEMFRGGDVIPPLVRGIGPTLLPRPQRFYFSFGARIPTQGLGLDDASLWSTRDAVESSIYRQLDQLKAYRHQDRESSWSWLRRRLAPVRVDA